MGNGIRETDLVAEPDPPRTVETAYSSVLNGVMNHGCKIVTALALDDQPASKSGIYRATVTEAGYVPGPEGVGDGEEPYLPSRPVPAGYCADSFLPMGIVAEERVTSAEDGRIEGAAAYRLTAFGQDIQPLLAYTAREVAESPHLTAPNDILGATNSTTGERAPTRSEKVLRAIDEGTATEEELIEEYDLPQEAARATTDRLAEGGAIAKRRPTRDGGRYYQVPDDIDYDSVETVYGRQSLTEAVMDVLEPGAEVNREKVAALIGSDQKEHISTTLSGLADQGVLHPSPNYVMRETGQDFLTILDTVKEGITDYIEAAPSTREAALDVMPADVTDAWREYTSETRRFQEEYNRPLWNAAREASGHVGQLPREEAYNRVTRIVGELGEAATDTVHERWTELFLEPRKRRTIGIYLDESPHVSGEAGGAEGGQNLWRLEAALEVPTGRD